MKIKHILLSVTIGLVAIGVITMGDSFAQQGPPPDIKVYIALDIENSRLPGQAVYLLADPDKSVTQDRIKIVLTFINKGKDIITPKGFSASPFHLYLTLTDPDGNAIIANKLKVVLKEDAPPPQTIDVDGEAIQVDPVETLPGGGQRWTLSITIPDAHAFYTLSKAGRYSVNAVIPMRTYSNIDYPGSPPYSKLDDPPNSPKWSGALYSNKEYFTLVADKDHDGYSYPVAISPYNALPDCNDNDPNEHPGQTWYKDADNDGYSDGTTNTESCTRPPGYKTAIELAGHTTGDCDDNNPNRNPGKTEIPCNGVDDDCNPATPDFPAPTLASPANGATNISITPTLSWNASICTGATYGLQVSISQTDWTGSNLKVNQSGITDTSKAVSGLANDTLYYWRVNATNAAGTSGWSSIWSFRTAKKTYLLTVTKAGTGSGNVTASPGTLTWNGNVGTATYDAGTKVTLTATANAGSTFIGWSASCSGTGNCSVVISGSKCTVNMCGPCKARATFKKN